MAGEGIITVTGNLGSDPDLRQTPNGVSVASFFIANTPRVKKNNEWQDGETIWFRCFIWNRDAVGAVNELRKGMRVLITGRFSTESFTNKDGELVRQLQINVDNYGIIPKNGAEPVAPKVDALDEEPITDPWAF